jgi:hypothetical protein
MHSRFVVATVASLSLACAHSGALADVIFPIAQLGDSFIGLFTVNLAAPVDVLHTSAFPRVLVRWLGRPPTQGR